MSVAELSRPHALSSLDADAIKEAILFHLRYSVGTSVSAALPRDIFHAVGLSVRQALIDQMDATEKAHLAQQSKRVYYLSMEFLIGKSLESNLINLGIFDECRDALAQLDVDLELILDSEPDAGLGSGGLGRLAACFIESMATVGLAGYGYGINYEYGFFKQEIKNGWQREKPDKWLTNSSPWQVCRPEEAVVVPIYGQVEHVLDRAGNHNPMWVGWHTIVGVPHDMPVVGYGGEVVNFLRLYAAHGSQDFDMDVFNEGDYIAAVEQKVRGETISKVLYPSDAIDSGRELRLVQEYFLVACSIRDLVRRHEREHDSILSLPEFVAVQLNDTHPALAVIELMRLLMDERDLSWDEAWNITTNTLAYTNHTLLPEAMEKWPLELFARMLPRHLEIIYETNRRLLEEVGRRWPGDSDKAASLSLIEEGAEKKIRMCNLAIVGTHSVNGVSELHSELIKTKLVPDFYALAPEKFNNKTNGITQRRWLLQSNPDLAGLLEQTIGSEWITDLDQLARLQDFAQDASFQDEFCRVKATNKSRLATIIKRTCGVTVDPQSMFDVQVKRIHEYKRQLLNALRIAHDYFRIVEDGVTPACPRTYIFAGKASPGYWRAKQIIGFINRMGKLVNDHPVAGDWMKIVFLPNYRVSLAERIFPASDLSEQISTAGFEASGTGNMKFQLNGAMTIGTLDGANVEIRQEVGEDNFFTFGLTAAEISAWYRDGGPVPRDHLHQSPELQRIFAAIRGDHFTPGQPGTFGWIYDALVESHDPYFHLADFAAYVGTQERATETYADCGQWARRAIINLAKSGKFSSDRTIRQYATDIWKVQSLR